MTSESGPATPPGPTASTPEAPLAVPTVPPLPRGPLVRWWAGFAVFGVPQAAGPIAFALLALPLTGSAESGAALVFAMTAAQVVGAVPVARFGRRFDAVRYLRALIGIRALALVGLTLLAVAGVPFGWWFGAVVLAGVVNGAAYGYQRMLLNRLVRPAGLPRALGIAATLNEITFATSPVLASALGAVSPVWAMVVMIVLGLGPMVLMPSVSGAPAGARAGDGDAAEGEADAGARGASAGEDGGTGGTGGTSRVPAVVLVWLVCAAASNAAAAIVEVGAVAFALAFGLGAGWAFVFGLVLCVGSVLGGMWVSMRNRRPSAAGVVVFFALTGLGNVLALVGGHLLVTLAGAALIGFYLPQLQTYFSLVVDDLSPEDRRAEMFSLLRTAGSIGIIVVSGAIALWGLHAAMTVSLVLVVVAIGLTARNAVRARGDGPLRARMRV